VIALIAILAYFLLTLALGRSGGMRDAVALGLVLATLGAAILGSCQRWLAAADATARRRLPWALAFLVGVELLAFFRYALIGQLLPGRAWIVLALAAIILAVPVIGYAWGGRILPRWRFPVVLTTYAALGACMILISPDPPVDVWHFQQRACRLLLEGENPYAALYPNIYSTTALYGEKVLKDGQVQSFPYPPLSLLLAVPGYLLGDVRWSLLAAILGTAALLVATGRRLGLPAGHHAELAAVILLYHPCGGHVLANGWTEPFLALAVAACAWAVAGRRKVVSGLALGAVLAVKQYGLLWVPSLWAAGQLRLRELIIGGLAAAAVTLPFVLWDPHAWWQGVVVFQIEQPYRTDALSVLAAVASSTGVQLPAALGFLAAAWVVGLILWRGGPTLAHAALSGAAVFLAFFVFNKQAFLNYYWFVSVLLLLAVVASAGEATASSDSTGAER
jgi:uncharacterized membrane protein